MYLSLSSQAAHPSSATPAGWPHVLTISTCGVHNVLFCYKAAELHVHASFVWGLAHAHPHVQRTLEPTPIQPQVLVSRACPSRCLTCKLRTCTWHTLHMAHINTWLSIWVRQEEITIWPCIIPLVSQLATIPAKQAAEPHLHAGAGR